MKKFTTTFFRQTYLFDGSLNRNLKSLKLMQVNLTTQIEIQKIEWCDFIIQIFLIQDLDDQYFSISIR